ncbi:uncharacterized protein ACRADG_008340 [Cochliomyia hominivorax]
MTYFANLKLLIATTLFVGATAKAANFDNFFPKFPDFPPIPKQPQQQQSAEKSPEYKEIVFGEDVEDAKVLSNYDYVYFTESDSSEISSEFSYPFGGFKSDDSQKITKIVLLIEKTNEDIDAEVIIKSGGVGENNVSLEVLIKNSNKLHYKATVYGTDSH